MIVYKITNKINGKIYIGQTIKSLKSRWKSHCTGNSHCHALNSAIKKYGKDAFTLDILSECKDLQTLNDAEQYFIDHYQSMTPIGYNLTTGGDSYTRSDETRAKISASQQGEKNHWVGKKHTLESRKKMSKAAKGKSKSLMHKQNLSKASKTRINNKPRLGSKVSKETKIKMSLSKIGRKASQKTKEKMSNSHKEIWAKRKELEINSVKFTSR